MPLHYIDGRFVKGSSGETIQVHNPATEEFIDDVPSALPPLPHQ